MTNLNLLGRILLVLISWHVMQTNAVFNVTLEAINVSNKFIAELQKNHTYANEQEMLDKLYNITDIFQAYYDKGVFQKNLDYNFEEYDEKPKGIDLLQKKYYRIIDYLSELYRPYLELELYWVRHEKDLFLSYAVKCSEPEMNQDFTRKYHEDRYRDLRKIPLRTLLNEMHALLTTIDNESGQSILSYLESEKVGLDDRFLNLQSHQQFLFKVGLEIAEKDSYAFILNQYCTSCLKILLDGKQFLSKEELEIVSPIIRRWTNNVRTDKKLSEEKQDFKIRNAKTYKRIIAAIAPLSRDKWNRSWQKDISGSYKIEYTSLNPIFQRYIINEIDMHENGYCNGDCKDYKQSKVLRCTHGNNDICGHQNQCKGTLWDCDDKFKTNSKICPADWKYDFYDSIQNNGKIYGKERGCDSKTIKADNWYYWFRRCDYCRCICEDSEINTNRHFNLRSVISNVDQNYVVTGVKFTIENHIVHIQIQQGKLLANRNIDKQSVNWMPIDSYAISDHNVTAGIDYHTISWKERTVALDTLESPKENQVLTGFRFKRVDDFLRLEIHVTPFDFASGKLLPKNSFWYFNDAEIKDRKELNFYLQESEYNLVNPTIDGYIKFAPDFDEINVGQVTIPHIETASLDPLLPIPNSGAGIFIQKDKPVLRLKLVDFDITKQFKA